jgi:N-acyl-phosphatidylethanolamine-hydrolysing phospholipase D
METRRVLRLGFARVLLPVLTTELTWGREGSEKMSPVPHLHETFRNLDAGFWKASNWTSVRFYLLHLFAMLNRDHAFAPLPAGAPDVDALRTNRPAPTVTWVGHSTLLVQLDGVSVLTDPTWALRVGSLSGTVGVRRFTPPGIAFEDLPPIDFVLISHDHYDHLDEPTVRRLARTFNPLFVVPLGIRSWLADREITNVSGLDWGQAVTVKELRIVCTPAQHGSGRSLLDNGRRLWASRVVIASKRFYFEGDTGYSPHLAMIEETFGPFDLVALPIGSYTPRQIAWPIHICPRRRSRARWISGRPGSSGPAGGHSNWHASRTTNRRTESPPKLYDSSSILERSRSPNRAKRWAGRAAALDLGPIGARERVR